MRAAKLKLFNVMGIDDLEIEPGNVTVIQGKNGEGKSSFIQALLALTDGGHDATLVRNGADEAVILLELDDGHEVRKRITPTGSTLTVKKDGHTIGSPQTYLNGLADAIAANPIAFMQADDERRLKLLLEAVSLELNDDDVFAAVGDVVEIDDVELLGKPLDVIARLRKKVYDERTGVNRTVKDSKATADQLEKSIPAEDPDAPAPEAEIERLEKENMEAPEAVNAAKALIDSEADDAIDAATTGLDNEIAELEAKLEELRQRRDDLTDAIEKKRDATKADIDADERTRAATVAEQLKALRKQVTDSAAVENTRSMLATLRQTVTEKQAEAERLTEALERLDDLKLSLLKDLPAGLDIVDGVLHDKNGVPWPKINTAERVKIAIRIAQMRVRDLPIVCADGMEVLDEDTFQKFVANASKSNLQFFLTRVTNDEGLNIITA